MDRPQNWQPIEVGKWEPVSHREPGEEFLFYRSVAAGLIDAVQENCSRGAFENMEGAGRLSNDPITNLKYHFVVTAAMLARFCMEGGMAMEEAFSLSDEYIRRMDCCGNLAEIVYIHDQMALDYVCQMRRLKRNIASSKQVAEAIDYIYVHIMERVTVNDLAEAVCVSPTHLSGSSALPESGGHDAQNLPGQKLHEQLECQPGTALLRQQQSPYIVRIISVVSVSSVSGT